VVAGLLVLAALLRIPDLIFRGRRTPTRGADAGHPLDRPGQLTSQIWIDKFTGAVFCYLGALRPASGATIPPPSRSGSPSRDRDGQFVCGSPPPQTVGGFVAGLLAVVSCR
jgi:hypothetical protein